MRIDLSRIKNMLNSIFFILLGEKCLNTEFFLVRILFSCIRTKYRKIRTRKNFVFGHFSRSGLYSRLDKLKTLNLNFYTEIFLFMKVLKLQPSKIKDGCTSQSTSLISFNKLKLFLILFQIKRVCLISKKMALQIRLVLLKIFQSFC